MKITFRYFFVILTAIFWLTIANGCGSGDEPIEATATPISAPAETSQSEANESAATEEEPAEVAVGSLPLEGSVVLWHSWAGREADALNEILGQVQGANPSLAIETLFVAYADLEQSYIEAVQAGGGPDLVLAPNWWLGNLVDTQAVAPIDELVNDQELSAYWPATVENLSWFGRAYGIPVNFELVSLFYNSSLVDPQNLPNSLEAMLTASTEDASGTMGIGLYNSLYHLYWGFPAFGAQMLDAQGKVILDQSPGAAGYLTWLIQMDQAPNVYIDLDYGMIIDRFKKGEFAFFVDGPWSIPELQQALGENLQVAMLPHGPNGPSKPWLSADGYFLNPNRPEDEQKLAAAAALALTDSQSGIRLAQIGAKLPANQQVPISDPLLSGFMSQARDAEPMPSTPEIYQVLGYGGDMLVKALNGVSDPNETVIETTALINEETGR